MVVERNRPNDTFGWGVVLSDETLANLQANDPESAAHVAIFSVYGTISRCIIVVRRVRSVVDGFSGIGRQRLLNILQERALGASGSS